MSDHDFPIAELGKVNPYGVYVLNSNTGFISLGTNHDTSEFAVSSIAAWWNACGKNTFPESKRIYITCDGGGSNSSRSRAWKCGLQEFANRTGLEVMVSHYPPGASKWNKIEHRMFCYISKNWQGQPLIDIETVARLISGTTTQKGLKVDCIWTTIFMKPYLNSREARRAIFEYIKGWYNRKMIHSTIGYMTPQQKEDEELKK